MLTWRGMLAILSLMIPLLASAEPIPVLILRPLSNNTDSLLSAGFQLHARHGDALISTLSWDGNLKLPADILRLPDQVGNYSNVYQVNPRGLANNPGLRDRLEILYLHDDLILIRGNPDQLNALSSAGVPFRAIPKIGYPLRPTNACRNGLDTMDPFVGVILDQVSPASYQSYIQSLQDFVTRNTYNPECDSAAFWILDQFQNMGLDAWLDSFQIGSLTRFNVIAELTGTLHPDQMYYLTAHFDATAGLPIFPEDVAPGADDDGSGAALVLECARVLSQFSFQNTVRFAVFAGNEQGLIGSEAYVAALPQSGEVYLGVFDADMIGWSGSDPWPPDLVLYSNSDPASTILANKVAEAISIYTPGFLQPLIIQDPTMVYADHAPFWDANIPAILAMEDEAWSPDLNPYYHSDNDLLQYLDIPYALHVLEAILASAADLSVPNGSTQPYLTADGVIIDDSQGNNNGQIEYGESVYMTIPVINAGGAGASAVNVVLSENQPFITLTDWQENYGNIASQDTVSIPNAFAADVALDVPDVYIFNVMVTMSSGTNQWISIVQMIAHAPDISLDELIVDDSFGGNGNGRLEPGEFADLDITLGNEGSYQAEDLLAGLTCTSPYIIVNTPSQSYGTLMPGSSAMRSFGVSALPTAPAYFLAEFTLSYSAAGGWTELDTFSLDVGDLTYVPTGPDEYGYTAYDINDEPFGPVYDWIEIDPHAGGPGTLLNFTDDDQTLYVNLPFTFTYYGLDYTELSVCSNGWIACGHTTSTAYSNSNIPGEGGPPAMIAPFWDDLSPQAEGSVSYYYDPTEARFTIEYYQVRDYQPSWQHMTFEVVLYDPASYPTTTGDAKILFQYGNLDNTSSCTVGIENHDQTVGIQYLYNTQYDQHATPIGDGMAILFTTGESFPDVTVTLTPYGAPIQIPAMGGSFDYNIEVANNEATSVSFDLWIDATLPNGSIYGPVLGPAALTVPGSFSANRDRTQSVPGGAPAGSYFYNAHVGSYPGTIWDTDSFGFSKLGDGEGPAWEGWDTWGEALDFGAATTVSTALPKEFALGQNYPNPFNATTVIPLELPQRSKVRVELFNVRGQSLGTVYEGVHDAGSPRIRIDASTLPSGIYVYRLIAEGLEDGGQFRGAGKMLVLK